MPLHKVGTSAWVNVSGTSGACWIEIDETVNSENRTSTITAYVTIRTRHEFDSIDMNGSVTLTANGKTYSFTRYENRTTVPAETDYRMFSTQQIVVNHAPNGTASVTVNFEPGYMQPYFCCYPGYATSVWFYCNAVYGSGSKTVDLYRLQDLTAAPPEETPGGDEYTPATPDVDIDWDAIDNNLIQSTAPAGGNPLTHLPYIIYNGNPVPLGKDTYTRMIDEGFNSAGERCWTLLIYEGYDYPLEFKSLGSAVLGVDVFMCGGGGGGGDGTIIDDTVNKKAVGGGGGAGGCLRNVIGATVERDAIYYATVGDGGQHGMDGESTYIFDIEAAGGKAGFSGYDADNEDKRKDVDETEIEEPETDEEESDETEDTTESTKSEKKPTAGLGGEAVRSNITGNSYAGGNGGVISETENTDPTAGAIGMYPFRFSTLDSASLAFKYLNMRFGSGGGGGSARYLGQVQDDGGAAGSPMAGRGGRSPMEGVVNVINGPLGQPGIDNSGCGGGGGGCSNNVQTFGGAGGRGVIILRNTRTPDAKYNGLIRDATGTASKVVTWTTVSKYYKQVETSNEIDGVSGAAPTASSASSASNSSNTGTSTNKTVGAFWDGLVRGESDGTKKVTGVTTTSTKPVTKQNLPGLVTTNKQTTDAIHNGVTRE